ncbi:hypothetical protein ACQP2T_57070 [Nonomuraea sp. CA-143628]|uniref:hypothetical protein n=1 Tax=Nonomuraea sp. CA-143628 TaxID=3239997 RepID=UPI003D8D9900
MVTELTMYEAGWRKVCGDLDNHPQVKILHALEGELDTGFTDVAASWAVLVSEQEVKAPAALEQCDLRFRELGRQWMGEGPYVNGEFYLTHIARAGSPGLDEEWIESWTGKELFPSSQLRVIDCHPITGTGHYAALRLLPGGDEPEIWWVAEPRYGAWKMDVGYREYLEMLQLTKGAFSWQFLFTRAPLDNEEFEGVRDRMENMLDALPVLFPGHDYKPLTERFSARLRDGRR